MFVASTVIALNTTPWNPGHSYHSPDSWSPDLNLPGCYAGSVV
ncbi:MAG: hypothetical protein AAGA99_11690 [Actinomycetota bacterium]